MFLDWEMGQSQMVPLEFAILFENWLGENCFLVDIPVLVMVIVLQGCNSVLVILAFT